MPNMTAEAEARHQKIALEKILWAIRNAERKRNRLRTRKENLDKNIADNEKQIGQLALSCRLMVGKLEESGWDRAAFEARTGLKLPE